MVFIFKGIKYRWSVKKFLLNCLICLIISLISALYLTNAVKATSDKEVRILTVRRGQTLWSIARQIAPELDPRDVIIRIKSDNKLQDSRIITGQILKITDLEYN